MNSFGVLKVNMQTACTHLHMYASHFTLFLSSPFSASGTAHPRVETTTKYVKRNIFQMCFGASRLFTILRSQSLFCCHTFFRSSSSVAVSGDRFDCFIVSLMCHCVIDRLNFINSYSIHIRQSKLIATICMNHESFVQWSPFYTGFIDLFIRRTI